MNGKYVCPLCGAEMVERKGTKITFYGCSEFPNCRGKRLLSGEPFGDDYGNGLSGEGKNGINLA